MEDERRGERRRGEDKLMGEGGLGGKDERGGDACT